MQRRVARETIFKLLPTLLVVAGLIGAELLLRSWATRKAGEERGRALPSPAERNLYQRPDPVLGFSLTPGYEAGGIRVNELGFRGPPLEQPKGARTFRLVAVGDSTTFGLAGAGCPYPEQLERELDSRRAGEVRFEVVNAGVEGYTSEHVLRLLSSRIEPLEPDLVAVYVGWNDLYWTDPAAANLPPLHGALDPPPRAARGGPTGAALRALQRIHLLQFLRRLLLVELPRTRATLLGVGEQAGQEEMEVDPQMGELFRWRLQRIVTAIRELRAVPVLMTLPSILSPSPSAGALELVHYPRWARGDYRRFLAVVNRFNQIVREVALESGSPLVDNAAHFDALGPREKERLFFDTLHMYCEGNGLIAEHMARVLVREKLLPAGGAG